MLYLKPYTPGVQGSPSHCFCVWKCQRTVLAKHCTILNINCYKELNHCEIQGAIYFKILIWGPSYSWLEWTKKPAGYNLPPKMFCTIFPLKKKICLACLWGKNILPLRNLSTPQLLCQIWHNIYQVK